MEEKKLLKNLIDLISWMVNWTKVSINQTGINLNFDEDQKLLTLMINNQALISNELKLFTLTIDNSKVISDHEIITELFASLLAFNLNVKLTINKKQYWFSLDSNNNLGYSVSNDQTPELNNESIIFKLSTIDYEIYGDLKTNFAIFTNYQYIFNTNDGNLLLTNDNKQNAIYFHQIKLPTLNLTNDKQLLFSYNLTLLNDNLSNNKIINSISVLSNSINQWFKIDKLIANFLNNINDDCKFNVYEEIVRHIQCYEWSIHAIKLQVIPFYNLATKSDYFIICCPSDNNELFKSWVNLKTHALIELTPTDYEMLKNKHVCNLSMFANNYLAKNYHYEVAIDELSAIANANYHWIKQILDGWLNNNEAFKSLLNDLNINEIPIVIINELPLACTWIDSTKQLWINKTVLEDQTDLLHEVATAFIYLFNQHHLNLTNWINSLITTQCLLSTTDIESSADRSPINSCNEEPTSSLIKMSFCLPLTELKWRGYIPVKYVLNNQEYQLESFKDIYVDTCEYCLNLDSVKLFQFFNDNHLQFNTTGNDFTRSRQIPGTNYFIETNLSGKDILMWTKKLLLFFNIDLNNVYYLIMKKNK